MGGCFSICRRGGLPADRAPCAFARRWRRFPREKARQYVLWNYSAAGGIHCKWEQASGIPGAFMFDGHFRRKQWGLNKREGNASASRCVVWDLNRARVSFAAMLARWVQFKRRTRCGFLWNHRASKRNRRGLKNWSTSPECAPYKGALQYMRFCI